MKTRPLILSTAAVSILVLLTVASCQAVALGRSLGSIGDMTEAVLSLSPGEGGEDEAGLALEVLPEDFQEWTEEEREAYLQGGPVATSDTPAGVDSGPMDVPAEEDGEIPQPGIDEVVEAILGASGDLPEPTEAPGIEAPPSSALPDPSTVVKLGKDTSLPMWFVYVASVLMMACLFTICYISKQRNERVSRRNRD